MLTAGSPAASWTGTGPVFGATRGPGDDSERNAESVSSVAPACTVTSTLPNPEMSAGRSALTAAG